MKLTRVEIESFRGYNEKRTFDCLADVVILHGPNGSGKTSFFDAVTWGLFGDIPRLRGSRDVVGDTHIQSYFSDGNAPHVSLHLASGSRTTLVTRRNSSLLVIDGGAEYDGAAAESWIAEQFRPSTNPDAWTIAEAKRRFLSAHLLGQEEVAAFLRSTNPRERFDALASLLGIDLVRRFFTHTTQVEKSGAAKVKALEARVENMNQRLEEIRVEQNRLAAGAPEGTSPTVERLLAELTGLASRSSEADVTVFLPSQPDVTAADLLSAAQELRASLTSLTEQAWDRVRRLQLVEAEQPEAVSRRLRQAELQRLLSTHTSTVEAAEASLASLTTQRDPVLRRLAEVRAAVRAASASADEFAAFLVNAQAFVTGETCPVCEQPISAEQILARLRARAKDVPDSLRLLDEERRRLEAEEARLNEQVAGPEASLVSLREQVRTLEVEQKRLHAAENTWQATLSAAGLADDPAVEEATGQRVAEAARAATVEQLVREVDVVITKARYLASEDRRSHLVDEERHAHGERARLLAEARDARTSLALVTGITSAAKESELEIVKRLMVEQRPLLNALYQRLRPHPILDHLDVEFGQFGERGEVYFHAIGGDRRANVSAIFSSAQLNAVAICIFLAVNISAGEKRFLLLDDPIQNMDDFNVLGLLDLLRAVSDGRQVIVSTHDAQLGELMRRKLRPLQLSRRTITHEFTGYDELGPHATTEIDEFSEPPRLLSAVVA